MATVTVRGEEVWRRIRERLGKKALVRAGVPEGASNGVTGELIAPQAAANEFGAPGIPARPFLRTTLNKKKDEWVRNVVAAFRAGRTPEEVLALVGGRMAEDIQATIMSNMPPRNSDLTRLRKNAEGAGKGTLVDTGSLVRSIDYEVKQG